MKLPRIPGLPACACFLAASLLLQGPGMAAPENWSEAQTRIQEWQRGVSPPKEQSKPVLRVVYFHGKDRDPLPGFQARLTRVMDDISGFYREGLKRYGISSEGLPLEKNEDGTLLLHMVKGEYDSDHYNYASGDETEEEIRQALKGSVDLDREFVLVLYGQCWKLPDGRWGFYAPYYGKYGSCQRWGFCHAADCELLDPLLLKDSESRMKYWEHYGDRDQSVAEFNSFYLGGIAHELGHGLGLPHNRESPQELKELGNSLMGSGNLTYRQELWKPNAKGSYLSLTDAIRLASHPLVTGSNAARFESAGGDFQMLEATSNGDHLQLRGQVSSKIPCYAVIAYVDPEGRNDYDARTYPVTVTDGSFTLPDIEVPRGPSALRLVACHANGETLMIGARLRGSNGKVDPDAVVAELMRSTLDDAESAVASGRPDAREMVERAKQKEFPDPDWKRSVSLLEKWLQPAPPLVDLATTDVESCYLSDAAWQEASSGWAGTPRDRWGAAPEMGQGLFLRIAGQLQEKGLPAHCPASHVFITAGKWSRFQATVGLRDGAGPVGRAIFIIKADGKEVYRSEQLREGQAAAVDLDITGVKELKLLTESGMNHTHTCWAVWGSPQVKR